MATTEAPATFSNSTAAANLSQTLTEGDATTPYLVTIDVLKASGGGARATLYSVDDGTKGDDNAPVVITNKAFAGYNTDLLWRDAAGATETSRAGASFWLTETGEVKYDATALAPQINALAVGETFTDTIEYTIRLGNGTLSIGRLTVTITGTNDAPVITSAAQTGTVQEDTALTASGQVTATDVDHGATATFTGAATGLYGNFTVDSTTGKWTYTLDNDHLQDLAAGEEHVELFTVTVTDEHGAAATQDVTITVRGTDDLAHIVPGGGTGAVTEDAPLLASATGDLQSTDIDSPEDRWLAASIGGSDHYGTLVFQDDGRWTYQLDNTNAAVNALNTGDSLEDVFQVSTADGQTTSITITIAGHTDQVPDPNDFDGNGGAGNDRIVDRYLSSALYGGSGNDTVWGNNGNDLIYGGSGNDELHGQAGNDTIYGGSGNDVLIGNAQRDVLVGGLGGDTLAGGTGADLFVFQSLADGRDVITDFQHAIDRIDVSALDADPLVDGDQPFAWGGVNPTSHGLWFGYVPGELNPDGSSGATVVYLDTTGDAVADLQIGVVGNVAFSQIDFVL